MSKAALWFLAEEIPCTRYPHDQENNQRVRETLVYACALAGEKADQMLKHLRSLHDYEGRLTVTCGPGCEGEEYLKECLTKAWAVWETNPSSNSCTPALGARWPMEGATTVAK